MFVLVLCLLIAAILPYLARIPVGMMMNEQGYNNHCPREQQKTFTGYGARAVAAHQNSFESLIIFAAAVLTVIATHHVSLLTQSLAVIYIISRVAYHVIFLKDLPNLRSSVWFIGLLCSLIMLGICL